MEILRIKKEEEEKKRQYNEEKEKLIGGVKYQTPPEQLIQQKPDETAPTFPSNNLYPSNQVPSMIHETKASARYVEFHLISLSVLITCTIFSSLITEKCLGLTATSNRELFF